MKNLFPLERANPRADLLMRIEYLVVPAVLVAISKRGSLSECVRDLVDEAVHRLKLTFPDRNVAAEICVHENTVEALVPFYYSLLNSRSACEADSRSRLQQGLNTCIHLAIQLSACTYAEEADKKVTKYFPDARHPSPRRRFLSTFLSFETEEENNTDACAFDDKVDKTLPKKGRNTVSVKVVPREENGDWDWGRFMVHVRDTAALPAFVSSDNLGLAVVDVFAYSWLLNLQWSVQLSPFGAILHLVCFRLLSSTLLPPSDFSVLRTARELCSECLHQRITDKSVKTTSSTIFGIPESTELPKSRASSELAVAQTPEVEAMNGSVASSPEAASELPVAVSEAASELPVAVSEAGSELPELRVETTASAPPVTEARNNSPVARDDSVAKVVQFVDLFESDPEC
eukprot:Rmarinus@m.22136